MTKIISISDEAYDRLKRIKGKRSFTNVILSLTEPKKRSLMDFAGMWRDMPEMDAIYEEILKDRQKQEERPSAQW